MGTVTTLPRGQALTRRDLEKMPDDGHRYELIDGSLIVTPAPSERHQTILLRLAVLLDQRCPREMKVLFAPFDVALGDDTIMQPDLLVARRADFTDRELPVAPLLAVEVLSPSTRHIDLSLKRARFETAGATSYWVIDPDGPSLTVWELEEGRYVERAHVVGDEAYDATAPFAATVAPSRLLD
jgi:Uma2 family endonuclease